MKKKYRLLKDLPGFKAGAIIEIDSFNSDNLINNPEWFELIDEERIIREKKRILHHKIFTLINEFEKGLSCKIEQIKIIRNSYDLSLNCIEIDFEYIIRMP